MDLLNGVAAVVTIASFVFALAVWFQSRLQSLTKDREALAETVTTIYGMAGAAIHDLERAFGESERIRLRQTDKCLGIMLGIREAATPYVSKGSIGPQDDLAKLVNDGVLWPKSTIGEEEKSRKVTEVWLVTPDLKPDSSEASTGEIVKGNLERGLRYVYFYPSDLSHKESELARLKLNIGVVEEAEESNGRVEFVELEPQKHERLFANGNIVLYYSDKDRSIPPRTFQELKLVKIPIRGAYWQEYDEHKAKELREILTNELEKNLGD